MSIPEGFKLVPVATVCLREGPGYGLTAVVMASAVINGSVKPGDTLYAAPTPPQPIYDEAKERELFEIHYRAEYEANSGNELSEWAIKSMRDGTGYGASRHYLNGQWAGWKACAQSRAKSMGDPQ